MCETSKTLLKESLKGSWYAQDQYTSNKSEAEIKFPETTSSKKIKLSEIVNENISAGRIMIDIDLLNNHLKDTACCRMCKSGQMQVQSDDLKQNGICSTLIWKCDNPNCSVQTDMQTSKTCSGGKIYEINRALVLGMRTLGKGREGAAKLCAALDLPAPISPKHYGAHNKSIESLTTPVIDQELSLSAEKIRKIKIENGEADNEGIIECGVTIDGSWLNRGVSSRHGFVSVISVDTGEVLDYHYMCSVCPDCETWDDKTSPEYLQWFVNHEPQCSMNYEGSSQNMETEGASVLYGRSIAKYKLRYNPFIGDGDSKAYKRVLKDKPYGDDFHIEKEECIGHIQKRMGTRLRNLINKSKGKSFTNFQKLSSAYLNLDETFCKIHEII